MSNSAAQPKSPLQAEALPRLPAGHAAPTGAALDSLVDQILGRAALHEAGMAAAEDDGHGARARGLPSLDVRLPPAALAAQAAHLAAAQTTEGAPEPLDAALPPGGGAEAEAAAPDAVTADSLIDLDAGWLPTDPERRDVFLQVFRFWHAKVNRQHAAQATPAFLYLVTTLPVLIKARDDLQAERLWEPKSEASQAKREAHPAWRKYCEFLPRAQQASSEIKAYRTISLITGLDDMLKRVTAAEKMYRQP